MGNVVRVAGGFQDLVKCESFDKVQDQENGP